MRLSLREIIAYTLFTIAFAAVALWGIVRGGRKPADPPPTTLPVELPPQRLSIVFGGDVMQHLPQVTAAHRDTLFDYAECFRYIRPFLDSADLVIFNFETTVSPDGRYSGYPLFASPAALADALRDCGVNAVVMANNHVMDRGRAGFEATLAALDDAGIKHTGVFRDSTQFFCNNPLFLEKNGFRLALLNYTYGTNGMPVPQGVIVNRIDTTRIAADLQRIDRALTDHIIIFFHWGDEYSMRPNREQQELSRWCHAQGVDFVIGSHPHVLQPLEPVTDTGGRLTGLTAYSLGNLVSNQRQRHTDGGMLLRVDISRDGAAPDKPAANRIDAGYLLTWVDTPILDGRRTYRILPAPVADTLLSFDRAARETWLRFLDDSRKLLTGSDPIREFFAPMPE